MGLEERYYTRKEEILNDKFINKHNRELFDKFFEYLERKLKRRNRLPKLDEGCYKTLGNYIGKFRNINNWFNNKAWKDLTENDIRQIYDDLEDGIIKNNKGLAFKDKTSYYNKIFKSRPFKMAGNKDEIAREVIELVKPDDEVRFCDEETFKRIVDVTRKPIYKLLLWLAWDIGENINALLQTRKRDCTRQSPPKGEAEYHINLRKEILKRSRRARGIITNYSETVKLLDLILKDLRDDDLVFPFQYRQAKQFLDSSVKLAKAKTIPRGEKITWKDFRSGMACHLLTKGWTSDEINARLGHKASSTEIDKYINYLNLDNNKPKAKIYETNIEQLQDQLDEAKRKSKLNEERYKRMQEKLLQVEKWAALKGLK